jgi:hypothetical protein
MKIHILKSDNIQKDKNTLYDNIEDKEAVFILDNPTIKLCEYIDKFNLNESEELYMIKICKEIKPIDVDYQGKNYTKFSDLLQDINLEVDSTIVVKGDFDESRKNEVRTQLSAIIQQFVYLNIQLGKIQVVTEKEAKDLEIVKRYEANVTRYEQLAKSVYDNVAAREFPNNDDLKNKVLCSLKKIQGYIAESRETELKIAVAASKKSGKSVVVNSMLECELAPTSLELATPNNCVYKKSDKYYLKYKGETKYFETPEDVKKYITPIFKNAEFNEKDKFAIEDMEIGYIPTTENLSSLTIYDTPGPDLAGTAHHTAADNAIKESDVLIFPIDYTKYLTDTETKYLKDIREIFAKKKKFYSLIFDINKTDQRFTSEGDKCMVRVIDFIREKLIAIAPEFKDSIIFGTSALTYFNALETPAINGFSDLKTAEVDNIEFEIGSRMAKNKLNGEQKTKLKFLKDQIGNVATFMNQTFTNLQQVKQFSGMPDLLNYVNYITQNKARAERLNNLIYSIDSEIKSIWNLFKFADLENQLAENKEKIEKAKKILETFSKEVKTIYDDNYPDIVEKAKLKKLDSTTLRNGFLEENANLKKISGFMRETFIDHDIDEKKCLENAIGDNFKTIYRDKLKTAFDASTNYRKDKKALSEEKIIDTFLDTLNSHFKELLINNIKQQIEDCTNDLKNDTKLIQNDLVKIVNERQQKLESAIVKLKTLLKSDCNIDFDIQSSSIDFAFKYSDEATPKSLEVNKDIHILFELAEAFGKSLETSPMSVDRDWFGIMNRLSKMGIIKVNEVCISLDKNMEVYDEHFKPILSKTVGDSLKNQIVSTKDTLTALVEKVVDEIIEQMETARENGYKNSTRASNAIDNTQALSENIKRLEEQKKNLVEIRSCVEPFQVSWSEITKTE